MEVTKDINRIKVVLVEKKRTNYNPQNEMFRLFETKRLFSKTKCSFFYIPYPFQHYKL